MTDTASNNKRIAKNTVFLYSRMLLITLVTLYTSRVLLAELGVVDFGIYNVVAGVVAMLAFLKSAMSLSVQRFLSFELGTGNKERLRSVFSMSFYAHIILALIIIAIAETLGLWFVQTQLVIPENRVGAALVVYHCVVAASVFSVLEIPYNAMILASEHFNIYAYVSVVDAGLRLAVAFILCVGICDKLELYGYLIMIITILIMSTYIIYVILNFPESRIRKIWRISVLKEVLTFSMWSLLGELAWVCVLQGINILINIFCGPTVNAARAISFQVNAAVTSLTRSFQQAVNPQLIKHYAAGNILEMNILLFRCTRFSFYLMLLITFPLLLETRFILELWLKEVPQHTVLFCQLVLIGGLVDGLSNLLATIAKAYGKIRKYQIIVSFVLMLNFPVSFILLKMGYFPEITMYVYMVVSLFLLYIRLYLTKEMVNLSPIDYIKQVIYPILKVSIVCTIILFSINYILHPSLYRFFISCLTSVIVVGIISFYLGMSCVERKNINIVMKKKLER